MKDITTDLTDRLALLDVRYGVVFGPYGGHVAQREQTLAHVARQLEGGLRAGDLDAVARVRGVVDPADLAEGGFWMTSLGRLMFAAGAFGDATVGQAFAAGVLGCSRQWVGELATSGRLARTPGNLVYASEVRALLKTRLLDGLVK